MKKFYIVFLMLMVARILSAQEGFLRHYTINDGLPSSETYAAYQDSKGYIWIASDMGVSRFDGYNFKVYTTADGLTDNTVFRFFEDHAGRLWFYTFSGRLCYMYNDTIYGKGLAVNEKIRSFLSSGFIDNLMVDRGDTVWMATNKGLLKIPPRAGPRITWDSIEIVNHLTTFLTDYGYLAVEKNTDKSSYLIIHANQQPEHRFLLPLPLEPFSRAFVATHNSKILQYSSSILIIDSAGHCQLTDKLSTPLDALQENDSTVWFSNTRSGVSLVKWFDFKHPEINLLKNLSVTNILKDREGGHWFTTLEDGVFYMPGNHFKYYIPDIKDWDYNQSHLCLLSNNKILLLTARTLLQYDLQNASTFKEIPNPESITVRYLNAFKHSDGNIWISANFGLYIADSNFKPIKVITLPLLDKAERDSRVLMEDENKNIWSLNHSALFKIDYKTRNVVKSLLVPSRAETICRDSRGRILVGTVNGLYQLDKDSFIFLGDQKAVFKNRFVDVKTSGGLIAGATRGAGLVILNGDSIYQVNMSSGLRSNMCRSVCFEKPNTILLATNNGLSYINLSFNPFKASVTNFTVSDGLPSNDIEQVTSFNNEIWALTKKGVAIFKPANVTGNNFPPPVYITKLRIDNVEKSILTDTILSPSTNFIGIDFVGLTFKNAGKQSYKYKLQGYDTAWTYTTNPFVQFTKLPPGGYKFIVYCINSAGIQSQVPAIYNFTLNWPFYQRWWFIVSVFILLLAAVITIAVFNVRRIRRREENKTELNRKIANLELQALRAQMNPHFIFNCLNAIQDFIINSDTQAAKRYLSSFAKLIRKTLDNSRKQSIRLEDELEFLRLYLELECMRFVNKFNYHIILEPGLENKHVLIPSMLLQPFIENAVRHSRIGNLPKQGELTITFSLKDNILICLVDDNGIGLKQSLKLKGEQQVLKEAHALDIIHERIASINEVHRSNISFTITDKSDISNETGTRVEINVPIE